MRPLHLLLAVFVTAVWGLNFIFIRFGLSDFSPTTLCALRFVLASIPLVFFVKPPQIPWYLTLLYGFFTFGLQFILLFWGMKEGVSPGIAALLAQTQIFFTIIFAAIFLKEHITRWQLLGALVAFSGVVVVFFHIGGELSLFGFFLVLMSSAAWGVGNLMSKKMGRVNVVSLIPWASLVALPLLLIVCYFIDGPQKMIHSLEGVSWLGFISVAYIAYCSTWIGYGGWNWLLSRYVVATVVPFTLLVPIFAMIGSIIFLNESLEPWKIAAGVLVIIGLGINLLGARLVSYVFRERYLKS